MAQMTGKETEYKVTGSVTVHMCNFFSRQQLRWCSTKNCRFHPLILSQFSFFFLITSSEWDVILVWEEEEEEEEKEEGRFARSQVVRVDDGKVRVLAVGGALVRAGRARGGAGHEGVVEGPGRALRLHSHQAAPSPDRRGVLGRSPSSSSYSSLGGLQVSVLRHEDVVIPVLTLGAEGRRHLHERW